MLTTLALVVPICVAPQSKDPYFDYTNLRPSDADYWAEIKDLPVLMASALELATASFEQGETRAVVARLVRGEDPHWKVEVVHLPPESDQPERFEVVVSAREPKVVGERKALHLESSSVLKAEVLMHNSLGVALNKFDFGLGVKAVQGRFIDEGAPQYEFELYHAEETLVRRYRMLASAKKPKLFGRLLLDRFPGEPLRQAQPTQLPSGLWIHDFVVGDGELLTQDAKVKCDYRTWLLDNTKLHDTYQTKRPEIFQVRGAPLAGMAEGMEGMRVGGRRKIVIPYDKAFGERGRGNIPGKAMIAVDVAGLEIAE